MARIGGRSLWLAWPVGLLCAGIVGALVWVALPAVPGTVNWIGDTLRAATSAPVAAAPSPVETAALDRRCRSGLPHPVPRPALGGAGLGARRAARSER